MHIPRAFIPLMLTGIWEASCLGMWQVRNLCTAPHTLWGTFVGVSVGCVPTQRWDGSVSGSCISRWGLEDVSFHWKDEMVNQKHSGGQVRGAFY